MAYHPQARYIVCICVYMYGGEYMYVCVIGACILYTRAPTHCVSMQANGLDERYNQTLFNSLATFAQECRSSWDERLLEVVYAYNTSYQESSKCTPFEAIFAQQAKVPVNFNAEFCYDHAMTRS